MVKSMKSAMSGLLLASMLALLPGGCPVTEEAADLLPPVAGVQQPAPPAPRVLLNRTFTLLELFQLRVNGLEQFSPSQAGKKITVRISGDATGSRLPLVVLDGSGDLVVNENNPLTNASTGEFIATSTAEHTVFAFDFGGPSALYTLTVTEE